MRQRYFNPDLSKIIPKLSLLRDDLQVQLDGLAPAHDMLAHAPTIENWRIEYVPMPVIAGIVSGHPKIWNGPVTTTDVWYLHENLEWVRTFSRFYRLGEYAGDADRLRAGLTPWHRRPQSQKQAD